VGAAVLVATLSGGTIAGAAGSAKKQQKVGSSGSVTMLTVSALTGSDSFEASYTASGEDPALYVINKAGGILGHKLVIKTIDTKSDPADALTAAQQQLATSSNVIGVQGPDTLSAPTLVPFFSSRKIPMISTAGQSEWDKTHNKYFWRMLPPDPANGVAMAYWAIAHEHLTKVALAFGTTPDAQGAKPGVVLGSKALHAKIVANVTLTPDQPSYRTQVASLLAAKPQVILTGSDGATAATFYGEMTQLGHLVPVIPDESRENSTYINPVSKAIGASAFDKYFTFVAAGNPPVNPATASLYHAIHAVSSQLAKPLSQWQANPFTDNNFDTYIIMALAATAAHSFNGAAVNSWIPRITDPGKGKTTVYTYAQGVAALKAGKKIRYVGALGPLTWSKYHNFWGSEAVQKDTPRGLLKTVAVIPASKIQSLGV
jgi:branched-chain amino acid transport system substrate-binding protein